MSEETELRDRIAKTIYGNQAVVYGYRDGLFANAAQAVIDDLGLTGEDRNDGSESRTAPDGAIVYGVKSRVTGRWEKR